MSMDEPLSINKMSGHSNGKVDEVIRSVATPSIVSLHVHPLQLVSDFCGLNTALIRKLSVRLVPDNGRQ